MSHGEVIDHPTAPRCFAIGPNDRGCNYADRTAFLELLSHREGILSAANRRGVSRVERRAEAIPHTFLIAPRMNDKFFDPVNY